MTTAILDAPIRPSVPAPALVDFTAEELTWLNGPGREGRYEWVDEQPVRKPMSVDANWIAGKVIYQLNRYLEDHPLGLVLVEQEYQCFPGKPRQMRKPDISFIRSDRLPRPHPRGHLRFAPDLAVEVVSPNDTVYDLDAKLEDYRAAGFPLVWVVNPDSRLVRIHVPGQPVVERRAGDTLHGGPTLSGFAVVVGAMVPDAGMAATP